MNTNLNSSAPEQEIADLQEQIASIQARAEQKAISRPAPLRHARAALRSIDKAVAAFDDEASLTALGAARTALEAWMAQQVVVAPPVAPIDDAAADSLEAKIQARVETFAVELAELIKHATLDAVTNVLDAAEHSAASVAAPRTTPDAAPLAPVSFALYEKQALLRALDECGGDRLSAAKLLEVGKSTLYRMVRKHGIG